MAAEVDNLF
jgi:CAF1 family ribonuclease